MELNELVAQLKDDHDSYGQWLYFLSIFGTPGGDEPWGWQIDGHHLVISTVVFDGRIVTTPTFMGSEPAIDRLPVAGSTPRRKPGCC